jgi:hypothetical protein
VVQLPVLGVITSFMTDSSDVTAAIHECFGAWAALGTSAEIVSSSPAMVRIFTHGGIAADTAPTFRHHAPDRHTLLITGAECVAVADAARRESLAYIARGVTRHRDEFLDGLLEPLTLFLLGALDRQPLHAAAIARNGTAIVLAGASGAGKSTLAYAARQLGFYTLADEPVYVQLLPSLRVWGRRARLHLTPEAVRHFPELHGAVPVRLPSGKPKIIINDADPGPRYADISGICLLGRSPHGRAALERIEPAQAVAAMTAQLDPGYDLFAASIGERITRIAECGAWKLALTDSPHDALPLLEQIAAELEARH